MCTGAGKYKIDLNNNLAKQCTQALNPDWAGGLFLAMNKKHVHERICS